MNVFEEFKKEIRAALDALKSETAGTLAELKAELKQIGEKVVGIEGKVTASETALSEATTDVKEVVESAELFLDRLEVVEAKLGAPRSIVEDEGEVDADKPKKPKNIWGDTVLPTEYKGRRR